VSKENEEKKAESKTLGKAKRMENHGQNVVWVSLEVMCITFAYIPLAKI
jgi:hypothetical protein